MIKTFLDLPGWNFDMDEVSAGVYEVVAKDAKGHRISLKGTNLDEVIEECKKMARKVCGDDGSCGQQGSKG